MDLVMAGDCKNKREELSNGERERVGPKKSVRDRVIVRESERDRKERGRPSNGEGEREGPCDVHK